MKYILLVLMCMVANLSVFSADLKEWTEGYYRLLKKHVSISTKDEIKLNVVDYVAVAKDPELKKLRTNLATLPHPKKLSEKERLAFWINVYNFLTIYRVTENPKINKLTDLNRWFTNVWKQPAGTVVGEEMTLDQIEHKIIRKNFKDPRVHMALVCAAISCPDLRNETYTGEKLEKQLQNQTTIFLSNTQKGLRVDSKMGVVFMSKIFKWFDEDFGNDPLKWLIDHKMVPESTGSFRVKYLEYNWNLNSK